MIETTNQTAPLGLDFEWPENVWVLEDPSSNTWISDLDENLVFSWAKFEEASAYRLDCIEEVYDDGTTMRDHLPTPTTVEGIKSEAVITVGIVLCDATGHELQRMYFR